MTVKPLKPPAATPSSTQDKPRVSNPAADLKGLLGPWKVVQCKAPKDADRLWPVYSGRRINPSKIDRVCFTATFVEFASLQDGSSQMKEYSIDPTATPKTLDLLDSEPRRFDVNGEIPGTRFPSQLIALGVYELEGGRLTIRFAEFQPSLKSDQRPKGIPVEPGSDDLLLVLERYQPTEEEKAIESDWAVISQVEDGKVIAEEKVRKTRLPFSSGGCGNGFTVFSTDNPSVGAWDRISSLYWGRFTLNPGSQPKSITLFNNRIMFQEHNGSTVPETLHGIYKLDGGRLTIAFRKGDAPPEKFESTPGSGVTLLVLERSKPAVGPKPGEPASGKSEAPPGATKSPTTRDGKPDKQ
jgi:uncharacterized protein (TIGR03067 family)